MMFQNNIIYMKWLLTPGKGYELDRREIYFSRDYLTIAFCKKVM